MKAKQPEVRIRAVVYTICSQSLSYKVPQLLFGSKSPLKNVSAFIRVVRVLSEYTRELPEIEKKLMDPDGNNTFERYVMVLRHRIYWAQKNLIKDAMEQFDILMTVADSKKHPNVRTFRANYQHLCAIAPLLDKVTRMITEVEVNCGQMRVARLTNIEDPVAQFDEIRPLTTRANEDEAIDCGMQLTSDEIEDF